MKTVGLIWDTYTPQVEAQIVRDVIAMQSSTGNRPAQLRIWCLPDAMRAITALGVEAGTSEDVTLWVTYKTGEEPVDAPEDALEIIERDLYVPHKESTLDDNPHSGYYLRPQGRIVNNKIRQLMPKHSGPTNPILVMLWGSNQDPDDQD